MCIRDRISTVGLGDFFRDALKASDQVIGSFDEYSRLYELTIIGTGLDGNKDTNVATASQGFLTACFDDRSNGWTSFRGFKQEGGLSLNNAYYTFSGGSLWQHHSPNVTRNNFYNSGTQESYVIPIFNDAPSLVKQFNTLAYEGDAGWQLSYVETDISNIGTIPTTASTFDTTLQLNGAAPNSIFNGANTSTNKQNEQIFWAIFVSPLNSQFKFSSVTDVTLTPSTGSTLSVTNPSAITDGQLVFQISHVVGSSNSIQILDIGGTGAELAFTVALLTVNTIDTISNSTITPASQIFNTAGNNTIQFTASAFSNYYVDNNNIVINTSGMPASTSIGSATATQSGDNVNYSIPVTVPATATAGTITVTGSATLKPTLIWTAISFGSDPGIFNTPAGTAAGTAYYISPFDNPDLRLATIVYTCTDTQVLTTSSQTVSYNVGGATITPALSSNNGILTFSVQLPNLTVDTVATATLGTYTPATATLGSIPTTANLVTAGTAITIPNTWNVQISVTPANNGGFGTSWIKFNGANGTAIVEPGDSFTISADANGTGALRTVDANIVCLNTRIQGGSSPLAPKTITIDQA